MGRGGSSETGAAPDVRRRATGTVPIRFCRVFDLYVLAETLNDSRHPRKEEAFEALEGAFVRAAGWSGDPSRLMKDEVLREILHEGGEPVSMSVEDRDLLREVVDDNEEFRSHLKGDEAEDGALEHKQQAAREIRLMLSDPEPISAAVAEANRKAVAAELAGASRRVRDEAEELSGTRALEMRKEDEGFAFYDQNGDRRAFIETRDGRQTVSYFDVLGREHRVGGPAVVAKDRSFYLRNGRFHRIDGPARIVFTRDGRVIEEHYVAGRRFEDLDEWKAAAADNPDGEDLVTIGLSFEPS